MGDGERQVVCEKTGGMMEKDVKLLTADVCSLYGIFTRRNPGFRV